MVPHKFQQKKISQLISAVIGVVSTRGSSDLLLRDLLIRRYSSGGEVNKNHPRTGICLHGDSASSVNYVRSQRSQLDQWVSQDGDQSETARVLSDSWNSDIFPGTYNAAVFAFSLSELVSQKTMIDGWQT